jgi:hypothetical protein
MEKREGKGAKKSKKKTFESEKPAATKEDDGLSRKQRAELKKAKKAAKADTGSLKSSPPSSPKSSPTAKTKTLTKKQLKRQVRA